MNKWMDDEIAEKEIKKTKLKSAILIFSIVIAFIVCSIYWIYFDETPFLLSKSPNNVNAVKIVEKGHGFITDIKIRFVKEGKTVKSEKRHVNNLNWAHEPGQYNIIWENDYYVKLTINYEFKTIVMEHYFSKYKD